MISCTIQLNPLEASGRIDRIVMVDSDVPTAMPLPLKVKLRLWTINLKKDTGSIFWKSLQAEPEN